MIISTKKGTPKGELEKIVDKFEKQGLDVTLITGKNYNVFGLVGDTTKIDERDVLGKVPPAVFAATHGDAALHASLQRKADHIRHGVRI